MLDLARFWGALLAQCTSISFKKAEKVARGKLERNRNDTGRETSKIAMYQLGKRIQHKTKIEKGPLGRYDGRHVNVVFLERLHSFERNENEEKSVARFFRNEYCTRFLRGIWDAKGALRSFDGSRFGQIPVGGTKGFGRQKKRWVL